MHTLKAHKPDMTDCPISKRNRGRCEIRIGDQGPMGGLLIDGEYGNNIIPLLSPEAGEIDLAKPDKGAFYATPLQALLRQRGITHVLFAGVTTEICVQTSMREANDRGYECLLIEDATESYFLEFKKSTIDMITAQGGIVGWAAESEDVITSLERAYG